MKIAAGKKFFERFGGQARAIYPQADWLLYEPPSAWSAPAEGMELAVLVDDAYSDAFKDAALKSPKLRWVHTENSGIDDTFYRQILDRGVCLTTSPGANAPEVVEFIFGLILGAVKRLDTFRLQQMHHQWQRLELESLSDKTLLIVGLGAIGSRVAAIAKTFDMHVLGIRKTSRVCMGLDELGTPVDLDQFLTKADIVVLALPYSPATHNLLSDRQFQLMKEKVLLINIARSGVIDTPALQRALVAKPAMHACLDVLTKELLPANADLWAVPNLFITPHIAWSSPLYRPRAAMIWLNNLARFREGEPLLHMVGRGPS